MSLGQRIQSFVLASGLGLLTTLGLAWAREEPAIEARQVDPASALTAGNQLFFAGLMEAAAAAYVAGYSPDHPHSTLAYNLGTVHHHLGRLPEAILWYRRAGEVQDPWLDENLWLARRSLSSRPLPPAGVLGFLALHADLPRWCGVGLAWLTVGFLWAASRLSFRSLTVALVLSGMVYAVSFVAERWGPLPAVLIEACQDGDAELSAGTEAWVRAVENDRYQIVDPPLICPSSAVVLVKGAGR